MNELCDIPISVKAIEKLAFAQIKAASIAAIRGGVI
jgi:hypothetical protein